ncbi:serine protease FAM111A-like isoform X2 [Xenia sp. Carnegie-2017]|uniref:serine protease FAM111A-like isoform X2 n=1 Tax=Xenia sp. Carnegie-2017 TaxID=2897299 RepID=UPI001F04BEB9|nr:serine protease FAM111A-like isoform X2 [Xenia sp. Carnegie-2017]
MAADKVRFYLSKRSSGKYYSMVVERNKSIWEAVEKKLDGANNTNTIFLAELKDSSHDKQKCWIPIQLRCGYIKTNSTVEWEKISQIAQTLPQGIPKTMEGTLFLVSAHEKRHNKFTMINDYDTNVGRFTNMCVVASPDQTFVQAFTEDGRFKSVDDFQLSRTTENSAYIDMNEKVIDHLESKYELLKIRAKSKKKRDSSDNSTSQQPQSSSSIKLEDSLTPKSSMDVGYLEKMLKDGKCYEFSEDSEKLTREERCAQMYKCQRTLVRYKLLGPDLFYQKKIPEAKLKAVQVKFSNKNVITRPVDFSKNICKLYDSVGYLKYGDSVQATCFLVSQKIVATNYHVAKDIQDALTSSLPGNEPNSKVSVIFNYEKANVSFDVHKSYEIKTPFNLAMDESLDFAFLQLKQPVKVMPLGEYVRCNVPSNGIVSIVGHPNGQRKQEELCSILSCDDLQNRGRECGLHYVNGELDVIDFLKRAENGEILPYDVGKMFNGSSGSPIFDMNCHVIGIHTGDFPINNSKIEYGTTFGAIIERLKSFQEGKKFIKEMFPKCDQISYPDVKKEQTESEDMEVD